MSKRRGSRPADQLELKDARPPAPPGRGPVVLPLGPRNFGIAQWVRDEGRVPFYRITHTDIRAASTAATMARQMGARDA